MNDPCSICTLSNEWLNKCINELTVIFSQRENYFLLSWHKNKLDIKTIFTTIELNGTHRFNSINVKVLPVCPTDNQTHTHLIQVNVFLTHLHWRSLSPCQSKGPHRVQCPGLDLLLPSPGPSLQLCWAVEPLTLRHTHVPPTSLGFTWAHTPGFTRFLRPSHFDFVLGAHFFARFFFLMI